MTITLCQANAQEIGEMAVNDELTSKCQYENILHFRHLPAVHHDFECVLHSAKVIWIDGLVDSPLQGGEPAPAPALK
jgi:hypothetical protein